MSYSLTTCYQLMPITSNYYSHDVCFSVSSFPKDIFLGVDRSRQRLCKFYNGNCSPTMSQPRHLSCGFHMFPLRDNFGMSENLHQSTGDSTGDSHRGNTPSTLIALEENFDQQESRPMVCWAMGISTEDLHPHQICGEL